MQFVFWLDLKAENHTLLLCADIRMVVWSTISRSLGASKRLANIAVAPATKSLVNNGKSIG